MLRFKFVLIALLRLRCPHCGEAALFEPVRALRSLHGWFDTRPGCPRCEYLYEREPNYFLQATWGTIYVPAALLGVALMFLLPRWFRLGDTALLLAIITPMVLLAFAISRHGRLLFLIIDHLLDPLSEDDRKNYRKQIAKLG
jgi:uncharacterized protein (DUF983 family)